VRVEPAVTQDDVAAHLVKNHGINVFAIKGEDHETITSTFASGSRIAPTSPWTMAPISSARCT